MRLNILHKRNRLRRFKSAEKLTGDVFASCEIASINRIRFVTRDDILLRLGDKRQRRRVRRKRRLMAGAWPAV